MLHCSTSPFYPLFACLDVDAHMHKGRNGLASGTRPSDIGIETRKKFRALATDFRAAARMPNARPWFFDPFVPTL